MTTYFQSYDEFGEPVTLIPGEIDCPVSDRDVIDRLAVTARRVIDMEDDYEDRLEAAGAKRGPPAHWFKEHGGWL